MDRGIRLGMMALSSIVILVLGTAAGGGLSSMARHVPSAQIARSSHLGRTPASTPIPLTIALEPRDRAGLEHFLARLYDPADPLYHQFLTPDQFADNFAPTPGEVNQVTQYLSARGLRISMVHRNRLFINVEGSAADVESAFQVELHQYLTPNGRVARAPTSEPLVADEVAPLLSGIVGLSDFTVRRSHARRQPFESSLGLMPSATPNVTGTGPGGGLAPVDIKNAYSLGGLGTGTGQTLALFELDGYTAADITTQYATEFSLTIPTLQNVLVDSFNGIPGGGADEVTLDIELMAALAPGATKIMVYEGPNTDQGVLDTYSKIATDNLAKSISTSWGEAESEISSPSLSAENTVFMQMATQGQSIFAAAGDNGAYDDGSTLSVDDPGSQPYMVSVGGSTLTMAAGQLYSSESSWDTSGLPSPEGGGGGTSSYVALPSWQQGLATNANLGSTSFRMVPDVSLNANPSTGYAIYFSDPINGAGWYMFGGTSCAAPLWAAFAALVNEARAAAPLSPLGFWNPTLYQVAPSSLGAGAFHDISDGSTNIYYPTTTGYDLATGWGSFKGSGLFSALTGGNLPPVAPTSLVLTPGGATTIGLSWAASSGAASYSVFRSTSLTGTYGAVVTGQVGVTYTDTGLSSGITYFYNVKAVNSGGTSGPSLTLSSSTTQLPPSSPTGLEATDL